MCRPAWGFENWTPSKDDVEEVARVERDLRRQPVPDTLRPDLPQESESREPAVVLDPMSGMPMLDDETTVVSTWAPLAADQTGAVTGALPPVPSSQLRPRESSVDEDLEAGPAGAKRARALHDGEPPADAEPA
eukprot:10305248-Lingulodinium_polyedra.AAC.1